DAHPTTCCAPPATMRRCAPAPASPPRRPWGPSASTSPAPRGRGGSPAPRRRGGALPGPRRRRGAGGGGPPPAPAGAGGVSGGRGVFLAAALGPAERRALEAGAAVVLRDGAHALPGQDTADGGSDPIESARPRMPGATLRRGPRREREALGFDNGYG